MPVTPHLLIAEVEANQNQKTITINDAFNKLESSVNKMFENASVGTGPISVSEAELTGNFLFNFSGASSNFDAEFPSLTSTNNTQRLFCVKNNDNTYACTVKASTGTGNTVTLASQETGIFYQDHEDIFALSIIKNNNTVLDWRESVKAATTVSGTLSNDFEAGDSIDGVTLVADDRILIKDQASGSENGIYIVQASGAPIRSADFGPEAQVSTGAAVIVEQGTTNSAALFVLTTTGSITIDTTPLSFSGIGSGGSLPYDVGARFVGQPNSDEVIFQYVCTRDVTFPAGLGTSVGVCGTTATALTTFSVEVNEVGFGTMSFASGSSSATFNSASAQQLSSGDVLSIKAPTSADTTLSDLVFTLAGVR